MSNLEESQPPTPWRDRVFLGAWTIGLAVLLLLIFAGVGLLFGDLRSVFLLKDIVSLTTVLPLYRLLAIGVVLVFSGVVAVVWRDVSRARIPCAHPPGGSKKDSGD